MKLPYGQGMWPAFWMLGDDFYSVGWPLSGEIDIMEFIGREPLTIHGHIHGPGYSGAGGPGAAFHLDEPPSEAFHHYAVEWEPTELRFFVDGEHYLTLTPDDVNGEWVYDHPFFLIVNLAVGGRWPGYPDGTTVFPQGLSIDYIRVYGLPETNEKHSLSIADDFSGWRLLQFPFENFRRADVQHPNAPKDGLSLSEVWAYRIHLPSISYIDQLRLY